MVGARRVLHVGGQIDDLIRSIHEMIKNLQDFVAIDSWRRLGDGDGGQLCDATPGKGLITCGAICPPNSTATQFIPAARNVPRDQPVELKNVAKPRPFL